LTESPFRLGLVGAGAVTSTLHVPGALASPHVVISAIVDPVVARAQQLARDWGLKAKIAAKVEDVARDVDGVVIATPNHTHRDIALACFAAGIHCLVEKPLATTVDDGEAMCAAAEKAGRVLAVGYTTRFRDEVLLLKELLDTRYFGAVRRFHYQEGTVGGWSPVSGYIADKKATGGGVLTVVGTHFIDRMLYWFGYPDSCRLVDDAKGGPESHCVASFGYRGGAFEGTLLLSKTVQFKAGLVIDTEKGDVVFPMGRSPLFFQPRENPGLKQVLAPRGRRVFTLAKDDAQLEIENFVDACRGKAPPMVDGRQGLLSVRLLNELYAKRSPLAEPWIETRERAVA
jgi:predicted dehydrogenase